jgi:hypothetical protein
VTPEQIALKLAMDFIEALLRAGPKLFELFRHVGGRDGFLVAIDATLVTARAKTDADLDAKHG